LKFAFVFFFGKSNGKSDKRSRIRESEGGDWQDEVNERSVSTGRKESDDGWPDFTRSQKDESEHYGEDPTDESGSDVEGWFSVLREGSREESGEESDDNKPQRKQVEVVESGERLSFGCVVEEEEEDSMETSSDGSNRDELSLRSVSCEILENSETNENEQNQIRENAELGKEVEEDQRDEGEDKDVGDFLANFVQSFD